MTSKHRRQRGSRTHGGGTHKNRRGAGHRGGRGDAGRSKHEFHNHESLGKNGFTPQDPVEFDEVAVQKLDEDAALYAAEGIAEETESGYQIDVHDVVEESPESDGVKVLGDGQVRRELVIIADEFTAPAVQMIEDAGGTALTPDQLPIKSSINNGDLMEDTQEYLDEKRSVVESGEKLQYDEVDRLIEVGREEDEIVAVRDIILQQYSSSDDLSADDAVSLYHLRELSEDYGIDSRFADELLEGYFSDVNLSEAHFEEVSAGLPERISYSEVREILDDREERIRQTDDEVFDGDKETQDLMVSANQKRYLFLAKDRLEATG